MTEEITANDQHDADAGAAQNTTGSGDGEHGGSAELPAHIDTVLISRVLEAAILAADGPLDRDAMLMLFDEAERPDRASLDLLLTGLAQSYQDRGIELREVASGFRFQVRKEMGPWVSRLWQEKAPRYSRAILETLALIAYRQPITRGEIEEIRGVAVNTQIVKTLLERGWVRIVGHRDVPGRPAMFATTRQFLDYFDLKNLEDLPTLSEIRDLDKINEELELEERAASAMVTDEEAPAAGSQVTIMEAIDQNEPEIDESTLMSLEQVDSVLSDFEAEFRRKPGADAVEEIAESLSPAVRSAAVHEHEQDAAAQAGQNAPEQDAAAQNAQEQRDGDIENQHDAGNNSATERGHNEPAQPVVGADSISEHSGNQHDSAATTADHDRQQSAIDPEQDTPRPHD